MMLKIGNNDAEDKKLMMLKVRNNDNEDKKMRNNDRWR